MKKLKANEKGYAPDSGCVNNLEYWNEIAK